MTHRRTRALLAAAAALAALAVTTLAASAPTTPVAASTVDDQAGIYAACVARLADPRPLTSAQRTWLRTCRDAFAPTPTTPTPTATPTVDPTTAPPLTATPTPTAPAGGCPLPDYPTPACTGVPAGTTLADLPSGYAITTPGAHLDAVHVHGDLFVRAAGAVITRSQIDGNLFNTDTGSVYEPFTITDSTVGVAGACITSPGIGWANYTATRVEILGHDDGWRVDGPGNVAIRDSYARLCWNPPELAPPDGSHSGGMQVDCTVQACTNILFDHNTVDNSIVVGGIRPGNSGMTVQSFTGNPVTGPVTVSDNLLLGGLYTMWLWWSTGTQPWTVHDNRVVDRSWYYGPVSSKGCAQQDWQGNTLVTVDGWSDTATYAGGYHVTGVVGPLSCS